MEEIQFKRPTLEDRALLHSFFEKYPSRSCERTFANEYLWSRHFDTAFAVIEGAVVFRANVGDIGYAYPLGEPEHVKAAIEVLLEYTKERGAEFVLYHVTEEQWKQLETWYPERFTITYDRDSADYVYETEKLATLAGKKLHGKRNHINKFKATYDNWSYETMTEENLEDCFQMALQWRRENGCEDDEEKRAELCVTLNFLRLFKELELTGGVLRVDGNVIAFTIGEEVCEDTFVVHIEKAFAEIQGAYPMINQQFVSHECMKYKYINREEDTGSEGLRKAKLSYRPAFLIEKGVVKEAK